MLKLETLSKRIMAYEHVTTSLIHELHMECPTPKDFGDMSKTIWGFPEMGAPQNGWFIMDNLNKQMMI
mgnify:CR=1 FL=1